MNKKIKKAWKINWSKIEEGYYHAGNIEPVYADTRNEAKTLLLPYIQEYRLLGTNDNVEYINIPLHRFKEGDKQYYEEYEDYLSIWKFEELEAIRIRKEKLETILTDDDIEFCYIRKGSYYRDNYCGYTDFKQEAGIYPKEKAVSHASSVQQITLEPIDIEEHNYMINKKLEYLKSKIIH